MLVHEGGWTPDQYQQWLSDTLVNALVRGGPDDATSTMSPSKRSR
jgi:hypothetical protein